jgi:two-component system, OmpR family, alkaline phosphatase synthesis response regulator PhoP
LEHQVNKRVLLVEDDKDFLELLSYFLSSRFSSVETAGSCLQALKKCNEQDFDAVIADYHLPDAKAIKIVELLAEQPSDTRIMIMTGDAHQKNLLDERSDIDRVVLKPFDLALLADFVNGDGMKVKQ